MFSTTLRSFLALTLATPAWASTWIVDDNGGPGVDFTTIAAAVAAAAPRDGIFVRAGSYDGFTLSEGVLVLGDPGVQVWGPVAVTNVGPGPRATIAGMTTRTILVQNCTAAVTIENVVARANGVEVAALGFNATVVVLACADVRLRTVDAASVASTGNGEDGVYVADARIEITHSRLEGSAGVDGGMNPLWHGTDGGDGLTIAGASDVHLSLSSVFGGVGGHDDWEWGIQGGDGGHGIHVTSAQARLLVTGIAANQIRGAPGGIAPFPACFTGDGHPGSGAFLGGSIARLSGASFFGAGYECGYPPPAPPVDGPYTNPNPADPSLAVSGQVMPGHELTLTLRGAPGSTARLRIGLEPVVQDVPNVDEDRMTVPLRTIDLGTLPPSGQATYQMPLSGRLTRGTLFIAQASTTSLTTGTTLTQSVTLTVN